MNGLIKFAKAFWAAATIFTLIFSAPRSLFAQSGSEWPLEIVNESGTEITSVRLSQTGMEKWSQNRVPAPIADGTSAELDIERASILGLCDVKIIAGGREIIWPRLPILEIFSITVGENFEPQYERIKLGA